MLTRTPRWTLMALVLTATIGSASPKQAQAPPAPAPAAAPSAMASPSTAPAPPANDLLNATLWMQKSVEYEATALTAFALARIRLDQALADPKWSALIPKEQGEAYQSLPPTIILDVDETILDNSGYPAWMTMKGTSFDPKTWNAYVNSMTSLPIPGAVEFARYADSKGVRVCYTQEDKARYPAPFQPIRGTGSGRGVGGYAVNPSTGMILKYQGSGRYAWSERTQNQQIATPEEFRQWGIAPTGDLAQRPEYANVARQIRNDQLARLGVVPESVMATGTVPTTPLGAEVTQSPQAAVGSFLAEWRQPYIDRIRAAHPGASEGQIWGFYTQRPEYQYELQLQGLLLPPQHTPEGPGSQ